MRPSKPQSKSQHDTTTNSEVEDELGVILKAWDEAETTEECNKVIDKATHTIKNLIAQEANKARLDELEELLHFRKGEVIGLPTIQDKIIDRINRLTAQNREAHHD